MTISHGIKKANGRGIRRTRDHLLRVDDAAMALGLSPKTIRDWIAQRRLSFVRLGRAVRVSESEIQRLIEIGTVPAKRAAR
jgi:excisionase family DNA binding protein